MARKRATKKDPSIYEIGAMLKEQLNRAALNPTINTYVPHKKQQEFHRSESQSRLYIGGNRSGKTVGGIVEDIWWLTNRHPFRETPEPPVRGRIVTVSYTEGVKQIIIPEITKWLPPSELKNGSWEDSYNAHDRLLTLDNDSTVELMSYDQKLEKFAGTSRHFCHWDEEPPKAIYDECKMRLLDTGGSGWITMTPVNGMTWVYDSLYLPGMAGESNTKVVVIDTEENPYISSAQIEEALSGLDSSERQARKQGKFVQIGGLVFKEFNPETMLIDPVIPPVGWTHYVSMDHGYNNPTCFLWHAVAPSGAIVTYDEIYDNERTITSYVEEVKERNTQEGRRPPDLYVADPAIRQRMANTGDSVQTTYARAGLPMVLGNNDVHIGVEKMNRYFRGGKWVITERCPNFIRELQRVKWKIYDTAKKRYDNNPREEIHKKDDHSTDSARYFISMMPDLVIPSRQDTRVEDINKQIRETLSPATSMVGGFRIDRALSAARPSDPNPEWTVIDETLGGIW